MNLTKSDIIRMPEKILFSDEDERILSFWKSEKIFEASMEQAKDNRKLNFYDGPIFATGLPHFGHILTGTIKDAIIRFATQRGFFVDRSFGWDCHGLPVEYEIDKKLNIRSPSDVKEIGITAYNNECRKIVARYAKDWEDIVGRLGRWVDFENDYKTLYPWYMESVWWVFKQLFEKGLIYRGVKVMPYSTACSTPLSNFESGQNYKDCVDPCATIAFPVTFKGSSETSNFLVWTTTSWTLPMNLAICVNPKVQYVEIRCRDESNQKLFILAKCRLQQIFKSKNYEIVQEFLGESLKDVRYTPLFPYFQEYGKQRNAFRVLVDDYVTIDRGTGIVHMAPFCGEDDYRVCLGAGLILKSGEVVCPVDDCGRFTEEVPDFAGCYVRDCNKKIIDVLKKQGNLLNSGTYKHSYPFCWRSDTPLIYKAISSWFLRVEGITEDLLDANSKTNWVPNVIKEKRFSNWLRGAKDWAISRNRYWGTPIPIWSSPEGDEVICIGSIEELERLSGQKIHDLHRENIDHIEIPSAIPGHPPLKRISEVFDCWFESGSMPFAQHHYPFNKKHDLADFFPADFIVEGIDQTRGWFYTLLVISTVLFNQAPFKNVIVNGLVLANDGQKMSKRKSNYPNVHDIIRKYGADAIRLYLINSPVVEGENIRFKEEGVRDVVKGILLPFYNSFRFFVQNAFRLNTAKGDEYFYDPSRYSENLMDVWILSYKESFLKFTIEEMKSYRLISIVPTFKRFLDQLTNWYIRLNRSRMKGDFGEKESLRSIDTLFAVLLDISKIMAPFAPFLSEFLYQRLGLFDRSKKYRSVHLEIISDPNSNLIQKGVEEKINRMQTVIVLGRTIRERHSISLKQPLRELIVIHEDKNYLKDILGVQDLILTELNLHSLKTSTDREKYGVTLKAHPNPKFLGKKFKGQYELIKEAIQKLSNTEIEESLAQKSFKILGQDLDLNQIYTRISISEKFGLNFGFQTGNDEILVLLDTQIDEELLEEGIAREIINSVQMLRKKANLIPIDPISVFYSTSHRQLKDIIIKHQSMIENIIKCSFRELEDFNMTFKMLDKCQIKYFQTDINIYFIDIPITPWVNVILSPEITERYTKGRKGSVFLQKRNGDLLSKNELIDEIIRIFGLYGIKFSVLMRDQTEVENVNLLCGKTIIVTRQRPKVFEEYPFPFARFKNDIIDGKLQTVFLENPII